MAKILITGGCGYIGSQTIIQLIRNTDHEVISVDSCLNSTERTVDRIEKITGKRVKNYKVDLCDLEAVKPVFEAHKDIAAVIHFAALKSVPESVANPIYYYNNNLQSLFNVIKLCEDYKVRNFIFSSSCSVYGNVPSPVTEETPLGEIQSPYAHTKKMAEEAVKFIAQKSDIKFVLLRYFNPVGADESGLIGEAPTNRPNNLVPVITQTASGIIPSMSVFGSDYETRDGSCVRDYVHVMDIADAHLAAVRESLNGTLPSSYEIINLGTGNGVTVLEAIHAFEEVSSVKLNYVIAPRREGDVGAIYSDCTKAKKLLKWEARKSITDMMKTAWSWQLNVNKGL